MPTAVSPHRSDRSRSRSSSQTLVGGPEQITNTHPGADWQNNNNDDGEQNIYVDDNVEEDDQPWPLAPPNLYLSSSWQTPSFRKQITNSNSERGVQSNNNDIGTQVVSAHPQGTRPIHRSAAPAPGRGISPERRTETEINNINSDLGVQNNNDYGGVQYAYSQSQDADDTDAPSPRGRLNSPPFSRRQSPPSSSGWDTQISNMNTDEGIQNNNNDKGTQYVYPTGEIRARTSRTSDWLSSPRRVSPRFGSSKRINNWNSGRGIQSNNNDLGTQYVHQTPMREERIPSTRSKVANLQRVRQGDSKTAASQSRGTPLAITSHNKTGTRAVREKGRKDKLVVGKGLDKEPVILGRKHML